MVEHLPNMYKALDLVPSTGERKRLLTIEGWRGMRSDRVEHFFGRSQDEESYFESGQENGAVFFFFSFLRQVLTMLLRLVSNSWVQVIFLPQSPE